MLQVQSKTDTTVYNIYAFKWCTLESPQGAVYDDSTAVSEQQSGSREDTIEHQHISKCDNHTYLLYINHYFMSIVGAYIFTSHRGMKIQPEPSECEMTCYIPRV